MRLPSAVLALALLVGAACGTSDSDSDGSVEPSDDSAAAPVPEPTAPPTTDTIPNEAVALPDLVIDVVTFGDAGSVRIANHGAESAAVGNVWLCQGTVQASLASIAGDEIPAGSKASVEAADIGGLSIEGGELALYGSGGCGDPEAIFGFVQWGTGGSRHNDAAAKGLWPAGASVTPDPAYGNIELGGDPADPQSWS